MQFLSGWVCVLFIDGVMLMWNPIRAEASVQRGEAVVLQLHRAEAGVRVCAGAAAAGAREGAEGESSARRGARGGEGGGRPAVRGSRGARAGLISAGSATVHVGAVAHELRVPGAAAVTAVPGQHLGMSRRIYSQYNLVFYYFIISYFSKMNPIGSVGIPIRCSQSCFPRFSVPPPS